MLTYVYGVVVLSLCRSRSGCGGGRGQPGDLGVVELENLTKCESCTASCPPGLCSPWWCVCVGRGWWGWWCGTQAVVLSCGSAAVTAPGPGLPGDLCLFCPEWLGGCRLVLWGTVSAVQSILGSVHVPVCQEPAPDGAWSLWTQRLAPSLLLLVNELWSVLPSPKGVEDGVPDTTTSFPSSRHSPHHRAVWKEQDSQSASTVALAGSMLSEGQDVSYR